MAREETGRRTGLREVTRRAVRAEITAKAVDLFVAQGFENTTVEQIADEVGMSTRSVFRYFPTKEDMVVGDLVELGEEVAAALRERPAAEPAWTALRHALDVCVRSLESRESGLRTATMTAATPALRTAMLAKHAHWQALLVPLVTERVEGAGASRELRASALVASALACLDVAGMQWTRVAGAVPLGTLLDEAVAAVRA